MVALLKVIATLSAAFFAGGGLFVSMVLYPAIMTDMASAVAQFGNIYRRAAPWQGSNAIVCLLAAMIVSALTGDWWWALGGLLVGVGSVHVACDDAGQQPAAGLKSTANPG